MYVAHGAIACETKPPFPDNSRQVDPYELPLIEPLLRPAVLS